MSAPARWGGAASSCREGRGFSQAVVIGEEIGIEVFGQGDVEGVGSREIVAVAPRSRGQRGYRRPVEVPWVECWRGGLALRLGPDPAGEVASQRTDLGPAVDRTALLRFQHPPFELYVPFSGIQLTDGLLSMVTQPSRRPVPLPPDE